MLEIISFVPGVMKLQMYERFSDPGMALYPARVTPAHTGSIAGNVEFPQRA